MIDCSSFVRAAVVVFMDGNSSDYADYEGQLFYAADLQQIQGLVIVDNFDAHMELLRKLWVLNNPDAQPPPHGLFCMPRHNGPLCNPSAPQVMLATRILCPSR